MKAPKCRLCGYGHYNYQPHVYAKRVDTVADVEAVLAAVDSAMVEEAKPENRQRKAVSGVVMPFGLGGSTNNARPASNKATPNVDVQGSAGDLAAPTAPASQAIKSAATTDTGFVTHEAIVTETVTKPKGGRPRVYASDADKQRAYRERHA